MPIERLGKINERFVRIVEMHVFSGLTLGEAGIPPES